MIEPEVIEKLIVGEIPDAEVSITDLTGTRDHYSVVVVAGSFEGLLPLKRHRIVNAALAEPLGTGELHALQLKTLTPGEHSPT